MAKKNIWYLVFDNMSGIIAFGKTKAKARAKAITYYKRNGMNAKWVKPAEACTYEVTQGYYSAKRDLYMLDHIWCTENEVEMKWA